MNNSRKSGVLFYFLLYLLYCSITCFRNKISLTSLEGNHLMCKEREEPVKRQCEIHKRNEQAMGFQSTLSQTFKYFPLRIRIFFVFWGEFQCLAWTFNAGIQWKSIDFVKSTSLLVSWSRHAAAWFSGMLPVQNRLHSFENVAQQPFRARSNGKRRPSPYVSTRLNSVQIDRRKINLISNRQLIS